LKQKMKWKAVGELLRICRSYSGFSQQYVADKLFIDRTLVSKIENGHVPVSSEIMKNWIDLTYEGWNVIGRMKQLLDQIKTTFNQPRFAI